MQETEYKLTENEKDISVESLKELFGSLVDDILYNT